MNRHETAHALVFAALVGALSQAYGYVPTIEMHRLAELVVDEVEHDHHHSTAEPARAVAYVD